MSKHSRKIRWSIVGILCMAAMTLAVLDGNMLGYVQSWIGTTFKALSGGLIGWIVSRYILELDLSSIEPGIARAIAGISQAFIIGSFALALATGA